MLPTRLFYYLLTADYRHRKDNLNMAINRRSYASLDIAKFIAAILVILLHLAPGLGLFNTFISRLAVPFFLVTAGYFLFRKMHLLIFIVWIIKAD